VQAAAGVTWNFELGQQVNAGDPIITLHSDDESRFELALAALKDAVKIETDVIVKKPDLILGRIGA
jgi:thymidine phosphorylase